MRRAEGREKPVASRLWKAPAAYLSLAFGCGVSRDMSLRINGIVLHMRCDELDKQYALAE